MKTPFSTADIMTHHSIKIPGGTDSNTVQNAQNPDPETEAAKWNVTRVSCNIFKIR